MKPHILRTGDRIYHGVFGYSLGSLGALLTAILINMGGKTGPAQIVFLTLSFMGITTHVVSFAGLQSDLIPKRSAAAGFAIIKVIGLLGGIISPFLIGAIKQATGNFAVPMFVYAGVLAGGAILAFQARLFLKNSRNVEKAKEIEFSDIEKRLNTKGENVALAPLGDEMT